MKRKPEEIYDIAKTPCELNQEEASAYMYGYNRACQNWEEFIKPKKLEDTNNNLGKKGD